VSQDPLNMTGLWEGTYSYPAFSGPTTPFVARIQESEGNLAGTIMEPNTMGWSTEELEAVLRGTRQGQSVDFTKTYDGSSDAAHAVDYVGQLSGDGNSVTGVWSLAAWDGTFEMWRETGWEGALSATSEEEVEAPPLVITDPTSDPRA
jgi:hypothetical protein